MHIDFLSETRDDLHPNKTWVSTYHLHKSSGLRLTLRAGRLESADILSHLGGHLGSLRHEVGRRLGCLGLGHREPRVGLRLSLEGHGLPGRAGVVRDGEDLLVLPVAEGLVLLLLLLRILLLVVLV